MNSDNIYMPLRILMFKSTGIIVFIDQLHSTGIIRVCRACRSLHGQLPHCLFIIIILSIKIRLVRNQNQPPVLASVLLGVQSVFTERTNRNKETTYIAT